MSEQPETLAAVLAEMRKAGYPFEWSRARVDSWLDRVEAAAERELDEARKARDEARETAEDALWELAELRERAPGNAAAMREALEKFLDLARRGLAFFTSYRYTEEENNELEDAFADAKSAIASPARNCDRFATAEDALDAFIREKEIKAADVDNMNLRDFFDWLFAPAEGGAE